MIDSEIHKEDLIKAIAKHGFGPENLEFVDEIPKAPMKASLCYKIEKRILIKKLISPEEKEANINMLFSKFQEDLPKITDDLKFVKLLVLYEMFHIVYRYQTDYECAKWAFYHLNKC